MKSLSGLFVITTVVVAQPVFAHEYWIEPEVWQVAEDGTIRADIKVGETFDGNFLAYLPVNFARLDIALAGKTQAIEGRIGDRPAIQVKSLGPGLNILVNTTQVTTVFYKDMEKFDSFVKHKDLAGTLETHAAKGFPMVDFRELYTRYSKSLVAVGDGAGEDEAFGLETEIVALENPYTDAALDGVDVKLNYRNEPRADAQIEIFERAEDGTVAVSTVRTNGQGVATIAVKPGHDYMLDAVVMREPSAELAADKKAIWESLWANLTFSVPIK